jgi:hypothetical protein
MSKRNRTTEQATQPIDAPVQPIEQPTEQVAAPIPSRSIVPVEYRKAMAAASKADPVRSAAKTARGNAVVDNGDPVAARLRGQPLDATWALATEAMGESTVQLLKVRYEKLNVGQIRMNVGNRIRAMIKDGTFVLK